MAKTFTVWIPAKKSINTEAKALLISLDLLGDALHSFCQKHNRKEDARKPKKNDQGKFPGSQKT